MFHVEFFILFGSKISPDVTPAEFQQNNICDKNRKCRVNLTLQVLFPLKYVKDIIISAKLTAFDSVI